MTDAIEHVVYIKELIELRSIVAGLPNEEAETWAEKIGNCINTEIKAL